MKKISLDTIQLSYEDQGSGQPVVLLHGYPLDSRMWEPQFAALSKVCRVIAPDLRGFGQSTLAEEDSASGVSMAQYATDIAKFLDAIKVTEPVILCGFSMGGYILWQFLKQYPQRVKAFVACDTRVIADTSEARQGRLKTAGEVMKTGVEPIITAMLPKLLSQETRNTRPDVVAQLVAIMHSCPPAAIAAALPGMADRPDVTADLASFTQPALVLAGAEDAISSSDEMRGFAEKLPNAEFVEIPNAGHMSNMENPQAFNEAFTAFIKKL